MNQRKWVTAERWKCCVPAGNGLLLRDIYIEICKDKMVSGLFKDSSKAVECVNHDILLNKFLCFMAY